MKLSSGDQAPAPAGDHSMSVRRIPAPPVSATWICSGKGVVQTDPASDLSFLFRHQLAEADIVCYSKADRPLDAPSLEGIAGHRLSARTGAGVDDWLRMIGVFSRASTEWMR